MASLRSFEHAGRGHSRKLAFAGSDEFRFARLGGGCAWAGGGRGDGEREGIVTATKVMLNATGWKATGMWRFFFRVSNQATYFALALSVLLCATPTVREGKITFPNGKTRTFANRPQVVGNADDAAQRGSPVSFRHELRFVRSWCLLLRIRVETAYEDEVKIVEVFDATGRRVGRSPRFYGDVHVLEKARRIILDGRTSHRLNFDTIILDQNGRAVKTIRRPNTSLLGVGHSEDQRLIWVASNMMKNGKPLADIQVLTHDGATVARRSLISGGPLIVKYGGRSYTFDIPVHEYPE